MAGFLSPVPPFRAAAPAAPVVVEFGVRGPRQFWFAGVDPVIATLGDVICTGAIDVTDQYSGISLKTKC